MRKMFRKSRYKVNVPSETPKVQPADADTDVRPFDGFDGSNSTHLSGDSSPAKGVMPNSPLKLAPLEDDTHDDYAQLSIKDAIDFHHTIKDLDEEHELHKTHAHPSSAAMAIWLGILIDGVPESIVIGKLAVQPGGVSISFIVGVFMANMPEAISSAVSMHHSGMSIRKVMLMWTSITVITGLGAATAAAVVPSNMSEDWHLGMSAIEGLAGGAMLTVIAETMLPEAFEQGGHYAGFSCLCGFLVTLFTAIAGT